jgi:RND superfamily putative drug exporter
VDRWARAVARQRWLAAGAGVAVISALALAATDLKMGSSDADTAARSGDAKTALVALERAGIGEGGLLPHEVLFEGGTDPEPVAAMLNRADGLHGAVGPAALDSRRGGSALVKAIRRFSSRSESPP